MAHYKRMLAQVRKARARALTQKSMAEAFGTSQGEVSRVENASDLYLSTLARYVSAMGGELSLVARFGDDDAVALAVGDVTGPDAPDLATVRERAVTPRNVPVRQRRD